VELEAALMSTGTLVEEEFNAWRMRRHGAMLWWWRSIALQMVTISGVMVVSIPAIFYLYSHVRTYLVYFTFLFFDASSSARYKV
jgi:hypothetical protein